MPSYLQGLTHSLHIFCLWGTKQERDISLGPVGVDSQGLHDGAFMFRIYPFGIENRS